MNKAKRIVTGFTIGLGLIIITASVIVSKVNKEKVVLPKYSILDEDVYDAPVKTQVELNILVSGKITEPGLKALLNSLYSSIKVRKGFKYHEHPTNIYIYAFTSKERFESGMGLWVAMLQLSPGDNRQTIIINERQISQIGAEPEEKLGLSEATRKQIWIEIVKAEDRATKDAEQRYPLPSPSKPGYSQSAARKRIEQQIDLQWKLNDKYKNELAKKHGLTLEQLKEIGTEGVTKEWPMPKF